MLLVQQGNDFLMRHFLRTGRIEKFAPTTPGLAGLGLDRFVAHAG
jgi:hypothetical protein